MSKPTFDGPFTVPRFGEPQARYQVLDTETGEVHGGEVVPWCAEHDSPFYSVARFHADGNDCRLEEPARHYVVKESE
jgi:hypothetical protein